MRERPTLLETGLRLIVFRFQDRPRHSQGDEADREMIANDDNSASYELSLHVSIGVFDHRMRDRAAASSFFDIGKAGATSRMPGPLNGSRQYMPSIPLDGASIAVRCMLEMSAGP
jgi:hypothetical protein